MIILSALFLLGQLAFGQVNQSWQGFPQTKWCGLNTFNDSSQIDDCDSPDAQNLLTDTGGLEKRPGNIRISQILSGYAVKMVGEWVAPSATRYLIAHASTTIYETDLGASPIAIGTVTVSQNVDMVGAYGKLIFQDGAANPWYWDGTSTATNTGMPTCQYMVFADERIYCANIPSESSSRVRVSSFASINYFTVPGNVSSVGDAPNYFDFQKDDGEGVTCFKATPWGKFIGKKHSTHILKGYDNLTYYKRLIDPKVGCTDTRSVQMVDGLLIWLSYDGIYGWTGSGPPLLLSKDIESLVKQMRQINSQAAQWVIDTFGDWSSTYISGGGNPNWNITTTPGSIFPSSSSFVDNSSTSFNMGTLTNLVSTQAVGGLPGQVLVAITSNTVEGGNFSSSGYWNCIGYPNNSTCDDNAYTGKSEGTTWVAQCPVGDAFCAASCMGAGACSGSKYALTYRLLQPSDLSVIASGVISNTFGETHDQQLSFSGITSTSAIIEFHATGSSDSFRKMLDTPPGFYLIFDHFGTCNNNLTCITGGTLGLKELVSVANVRVSSYPPTASILSRSFDTKVTTATHSAFSVNITSNATGALTFKEQSSADNSTWDSLVSINPNAQPTKKQRYWRYQGNFTQASGTVAAHIDQIGTQVAIGTGTDDSPVHFIGSNITSWKAFNATDTNDGGVKYLVRSATYSFSYNDPSIVWQRQNNNQTISISTNPYFQFRIDSSSVVYSTENAQVNRVAVNWQEGVDKPLASGFVNHRYFLCGQFSATATTNDKCLMLQRNNKWIPWVGPAPGAMGLFNNNLVVGDGGTNSYVWKIMQDNIYQDDGSAINSYWTTKDFTYDKPFQQKILHELWLDSIYQSSATLTVGYATDKSSTWTTRTTNLGSVANIANKRIPLTTGYTLGKYLKFQFSNSTIDQYIKLNGYMPLVELKDRIAE